MMNINYARALEVRARWMQDLNLPYGGGKDSAQFLRFSREGLSRGDTFFMVSKFCSLVEHAAQTLPEDLSFDLCWLQSKEGWLWLETSVEVQYSNFTEKPFATALYWSVANYSDDGIVGVRTGKQINAVQVSQYLIKDKYRDTETCFGTDTIYLREGECWKDSVWKNTSQLKFLYAVFYLMAQRLSVSVKYNTDRSTKRRNERLGYSVQPFIRLITLRRLEEARKKEGSTISVDWQWQWEVRGHWRNQYLPSTGEHKPVFVEAYIKGPPEKPLKLPGLKLFVARR